MQFAALKIDCNLPIHYVHWHFSCFEFLLIVNSAVTNILIGVLYTYAWNSEGIDLETDHFTLCS